jgi:hydrogenase/urease accessory protein HupE
MRRLAILGLVALLAPQARPAAAHTVGVSRGEYRVSETELAAALTFARSELESAVPGLDENGDGMLTATEVLAGRPRLAALLARGLEVRTGSRFCDGGFEGADLTEQDGLAVRATYRCAGGGALSVRLGLLESLSLGHRHIATATTEGGGVVRAVLYETNPELRVEPGGNANVPFQLFRMGIRHILTGYDHLLFLLGLILVGGRLGPLLVVVTAFTVAHSITLGLAALGLWAPSPRLVEPAIALSIAYVGIENWFVRDARRRWLITFPFGLVHGFGFAGALREIALPSSQIPLALASFNLGVEAGQLAVLALVLPAFLWLGRRSWFAGTGVRTLSTAIALAGLVWFVQRVA